MSEVTKPGGKELQKWLTSLLVSAVPLLLPISFEIRIFLVITVAAIMLWMFELVSEAVVGLLLPVMYILFNVATPDTAFKGWASSTPWITIGGLMVGTAFTGSGMVKRIAYKMLVLTGGTLTGLVVGLSLTCLVLTPIIPSIMGKAALMTPIVVGICQALGVEKKSRAASMLMLTMFLALWSPKMAFLTASADSVMTAGILRQHYAYPLTWFGWAEAMFVPAMLWTALSIPLVLLLRPEKIHLEMDWLKSRYAELGPVSPRERKSIVLALLLLLGLATDNLHHIDSTWIMMLAGSSCFFPGMRLLKTEDFNKISFSIVFFLAGAVAIGSVTTALGLAESIGRFVTPFFQEQSSLVFIMSLYLLSILLVFFLNPLALIGTMVGPVADICTSLGYPAILGGYAMIMGFNQAMFPYQIAPLMLIYGFGYIRLSHLISIMSVRIFAGLLFMPLIVYPYWKWIGMVD